MTPNRLRDILLARGGRVLISDLRKCEAFRSDTVIDEAQRKGLALRVAGK